MLNPARPSPTLLRWLVYVQYLALVAMAFLYPAAHAADLDAVNGAGLSPQFVRLSLNQQVIAEAVLVMRNVQGDWLIPVEMMREARLVVPPEQEHIIEDGKAYVPVSTMSVTRLAFDEKTQSLDLVLTPSMFMPSHLRARSVREPSVLSEPAGMFVNYDLSLTSSAAVRSQSLLTEWGGAIGPGLGLLNIGAISDDDSWRFVRLDTSYILDVPSELTTLRVGDAVTRPPIALGRPVRFGGVQYSTNFRMRPDLITMPVPTLNGQAALPSMVDLYVNNVLQHSTSVPPGPFSITTAPVVTGDGDILLKVRDITGREEFISGRIYASASLLAPGLSEFSVEAGGLRENYGLPDNAYKTLFASGAYRQGISERLTIESGASAAAGGPYGMLGGATLAVPGWGLVSLAAGLSHDGDHVGAQFAASIERRTTQGSITLRSERADSRYRQLGVDPGMSTRSLDSVFASYRFDGIGSLGASYTRRQQRLSSSVTEIIGLSFSTRRTSLGSVIFSALQSRGDDSSYSLSVYWMLPIDREVNASLSHIANQRIPDTTLLQVQKSAPYGEGIGWRLQTAINAAQQAAVHVQTAQGTFRAEAASFQGQDSARLGFSGGMARLGDRWFRSRRITGSYGLVHLPGIPDARIFVDNQYTARTDKDGYALLPTLHPYVRNHVSLAQSDLPMDVRIDQLVSRPVPGWRSGVMVNFAVKKITSATLRIVDRKGNDIPAGSMVTVQGSAEPFPVGREGVAYIEGLSADNELRVQWPGHQCTVSVPYAPSEDLVPYLGEFMCKELAE